MTISWTSFQSLSSADYKCITELIFQVSLAKDQLVNSVEARQLFGRWLPDCFHPKKERFLFKFTYFYYFIKYFTNIIRLF